MSGGHVIPSLAYVVRGLTLLFWAVPGVLLTATATALDPSWRAFGHAPAIVAAGAMAYGLIQLRHFQPRERIWQAARHRALLLALTLTALAPTPLWWQRVPGEPYFARGMILLVFTGVFLLVALNDVLRRLAAMLPDETLRSETRFFTQLNVGMLLAVIVGCGSWFGMRFWPEPPLLLHRIHLILELTRPWLLIMSLLLPVALTMTLLWKAKEVILQSVFRGWSPPVIAPPKIP